MLNATFRPLHQWPNPRIAHKAAQFKAGWLNTLDMLEHELGKLRAHDIVIQIEDPEGIKGIRNDGSYRIVSKSHYPNKAGVILTFESPKGSISMPCDRYDDWQDNLRAIALSLEALRPVDRYGVTRGNEQYRGWAQIEPPSNGMDREKALEVIASILGAPRDAVDANPAAFVREARIRYHPDSTTDEAVKKTRHEMSALISKAEAVLCQEGGK
jgi:hypothetical protein